MQGVGRIVTYLGHANGALIRFHCERSSGESVRPSATPRTQSFSAPSPRRHSDRHDMAEFDHTLYARFNFGQGFDTGEWTESPRPAGMFMDFARSGRLLKKNAQCVQTSDHREV
jgi:hypothetical protein